VTTRDPGSVNRVLDCVVHCHHFQFGLRRSNALCVMSAAATSKSRSTGAEWSKLATAARRSARSQGTGRTLFKIDWNKLG